MSQTAGPGPRLDAERRLGGTARLFLGFIIGALFALVPMYYFYMGREAALRGAAAHDQPFVPSPEPSRLPIEPAAGRGNSKPFASRLTYELSRPPEERVAAPQPPKPVPATVTAVAPARAQAVQSLPLPPASSVIAAAPPSERVANARPISAVPLDPRDRAVEIEKEGQKPEYREASRPQAKTSPLELKALPAEQKIAPAKAPVVVVAKAAPEKPKAAPAPVARVIEGRTIELKPEKGPEPSTRPAPAGDPPGARAEPEERVGGVTPIKPPAKAPERAVGAAAPAKSPERTLVATAPAATAEMAVSRPEAVPAAAASAEVQSRLEATRGWLAASPPTTHTIQLMGSNSEEQLKAHLKSLEKVVEPSQLYIFRTKAHGKPSITVVYGAYADRQSAQQALEKLPASIVANKPVLRTVSGIRTEMKQHNTVGDAVTQ